MDESLFTKKDIITTNELRQLKTSKTTFYKNIDHLGFKKVAHGIYAKKNALIDPLFIISKRCPQAVFSHDEALFYYGLIDNEPQKVTFTIYSGYNKTKLQKDNYKVFTIKKDLLDLGKIYIEDQFKNVVSIYDLERTICDLIRSRSYYDVETFNKALKTYAKRKDKDLGKLFEYARKFSIDKILRKYLEILL